MHASTLEVWSAVSATMPAGTTHQALRPALPKMPAATLSRKLQNLACMGYLCCSRKGPGGIWQTTDKVPLALLPASEQPAPTKRKRVHRPYKRREPADVARPAPSGPPPGVPNSVFALGALAMQQS